MSFAAIASLLGAFIQAGAQADANARQEKVAKDRLRFDEEQAKRREDLLTADQVDAFGNRITFSDTTGFETILAPFIQALTDAQKEEQYKSVALDSKRNRAARERADERSGVAHNAFMDAFSAYENRPTVDEGKAQADEVTQAIRMFGSQNTPNEAAMNAAIRSGNPRTIAATTGGGRPAQLLAAAIADAKKRGTQGALSEKSARDATGMQELAALMQLASGAPQANLMFGNDAEMQSGKASAALQALSQAIFQNQQQRGDAYNLLYDAAGKTVDTSGIFNSLGQLMEGFGGGKTGSTTTSYRFNDRQVPAELWQHVMQNSTIV